MKKIKILELTAIGDTIKAFLTPLIDRLTNEGYEVTCCCSKGKASDELMSRGYKVKNIEIAREINLILNVKAIFKLCRYMRQERFDVVHVHTPIAAVLGRIAARLAGIPIIIQTVHGFYFHDRVSKIKYKVFVNIEKFVGRLFTDYTFTVSDEDRINAINEGVLKSDRVFTILNGIDVENKFNPQKIDMELLNKKRRDLNIIESDKVIIFIGRIVKIKGIVELAEAFNRIKRHNYKLLIVGECPESERDQVTYTHITEEASRNKNIIMTGVRSDISYLLCLSDLFVLPSYIEGLPVSSIEAMAMGKPVIVSNIRGSREEVVDGENGFLVEVGDVERLKDKIVEILENPALSVSMGKNARLRAEELYDEEKVLDREVKLLNRIILERKVRN